MKQFEEQNLQSNTARANLLANSGSNFSNVANETEGVFSTLHHFFNDRERVADKIGQQNAEIEGNKNAQENHAFYLNTENKQKELNADLARKDISPAEKDLTQRELNTTNQNLNDYREGLKRHATFNIADLARQKTQIALYKTDLSTRYTEMTNQAYEKYKDDPKRFADAQNEIHKTIYDKVPDDIIGSVTNSINNIDNQVTNKVNQNFIVKQKDILTASTTKNVESNVAAGSVLAYHGGDYSVPLKNIQDSYSLLYQHNIITKTQYTTQMLKIGKQFKSHQIDGEFDKTINYDIKDKNYYPTDDDIKKGYAYIAEYEKQSKKQKGETDDEYLKRTGAFDENDIQRKITSMRKKLDYGIALNKKKRVGDLHEIKGLKNNTYKQMDKGITTTDESALQSKLATKKEKEEYAYHLAVKNRIQTIDSAPMTSRKAEIDKLRAKETSKKGINSGEQLVLKTTESNYKDDKHTLKTDPISLPIRDGEFTEIKDFTSPDTLMELQKRLTSKKRGNLQRQYSTDTDRILTNDEKERFNDLMNRNPSQTLPFVSTLRKTIGAEQTTQILKGIYKKHPSAVVYAANIYSDRPRVATQIQNGIEAERNGAKLSTDGDTAVSLDSRASSLKKYNESIQPMLIKMGATSTAMKDSARALMIENPSMTPEEAYKAVTGSEIDNGIITNYPDWDYDDTFDAIESKTIKPTKTTPKTTENNGKKLIDLPEKQTESFADYTNGEPKRGYDELFSDIHHERVQLQSVGPHKYAFKYIDSGSYATTKDNKPLIFDATSIKEKD